MPHKYLIYHRSVSSHTLKKSPLTEYEGYLKILEIITDIY